MTERVVAYSPNPTRLVRVVSEQAAAGTQVMAAFLNPDAARSYLQRHPLRVVGEQLDGAVATAPAAVPDFAPPPAPGFSPPPPQPGLAPPPPSAFPSQVPPPPQPGAQFSPPPPPPMGAPAMEAMTARRSGAPGQVF